MFFLARRRERPTPGIWSRGGDGGGIKLDFDRNRNRAGARTLYRFIPSPRSSCSTSPKTRPPNGERIPSNTRVPHAAGPASPPNDMVYHERPINRAMIADIFTTSKCDKPSSRGCCVSIHRSIGFFPSLSSTCRGPAMRADEIRFIAPRRTLVLPITSPVP